MLPRGVARRAGRRFLIAVVVLVALAAIGGTSLVTAGQDQLARVRAATDKFHTLAVANDAGYGEFYVCTDHVTDGTMGQHYVNLDLVLDTATRRADGRPARIPKRSCTSRRSTAATASSASSTSCSRRRGTPPTTRRRRCSGRRSPWSRRATATRLPPFYELHAWIWRPNPSGIFKDWNPSVSCRGQGDPA